MMAEIVVVAWYDRLIRYLGYLPSGFFVARLWPKVEQRRQSVTRGRKGAGSATAVSCADSYLFGQRKMDFRIIRRRKIHEEVAQQIETAISSGHFEIGDQLPSERELMDKFGVGRPAIREALLHLERMGLVHLSPGEKARVTKPTIHGLVEQLSGAARHFLATPLGEASFQDARRVFEAGIAYNAALSANDEEIATLEKALEANRQALNNMTEFEKTDIRFHIELTKIGGNPIFLALHTALVDWLSLQRFISLQLPGVAEEAFESHKAIFNAVAAHEAPFAWAAMDTHLRQVFRNLDQARLRGVA